MKVGVMIMIATIAIDHRGGYNEGFLDNDRNDCNCSVVVVMMIMVAMIT